MTEAELVLDGCIDLWLRGQDPDPLLKAHPSISAEVSQLLHLAQAVRGSALLFDLVLHRQYPLDAT